MIVARLKGGLGNQLFIYAAARRLSLKNNVPLKLDIISGFQHDYYQRKYRLNHFNIKGEIASLDQCLSGIFGRLHRQLRKRISKFYRYERRPYIAEEFSQFDVRLLTLKVKGKIYLDGVWASERYFKDIEEIIRDDLTILTKPDAGTLAMAEKIQSTHSVGIHVRRLRGLPSNTSAKSDSLNQALSVDYYKKGIEMIASKIPEPVFYCFGDYPQWLIENVKIDYPIILINHEKDYEDLWLMSLCKYFIIANSSFSWWAAWLSNHKEKIVIVPDPDRYSDLPGIGIFNRDAVPPGWLTI